MLYYKRQFRSCIEMLFSYTNCSLWEVLFPGKSEVRSIFSISFYQHIIILYSGKYCFFILFRHIVNALEHDCKSSRKTKHSSVVVVEIVFILPRTVIPPVFPSTKHKNKTKAMRWHITNGELYEI